MSNTSSSITCRMMCALNFHCLRLFRLNSDILKPDVSILCLKRFLSPPDARDLPRPLFSSCSLWLRLNPHTSSTVSTLSRESVIPRLVTWSDSSWTRHSLDIPGFRSLNNHPIPVFSEHGPYWWKPIYSTWEEKHASVNHNYDTQIKILTY